MTGNPLAIIAQATGVKMSKASPSVKLLVGKMRDAEEKMDNDVSKLFDQMLDEGVSMHECNIGWNVNPRTNVTIVCKYDTGTKMLGEG